MDVRVNDRMGCNDCSSGWVAWGDSTHRDGDRAKPKEICCMNTEGQTRANDYLAEMTSLVADKGRLEGHTTRRWGMSSVNMYLERMKKK